MIDNNDNIIWASAADGSWGGCKRDDLIIVRESELTDDEREAIEDAAEVGDDGTIINILLAVDERKSVDSCVCPSKPRWKGEWGSNA